MQLIDQKVKKIMEGCKLRAHDAGLNIQGETLEYIITNQDMIGLSSKSMIPTLYNYWAQDVEVIRDKWIYEVRPHNPYETVINTRPAISFYNDNNPDWLNIMIFYHVLAHIDFFQNNVFFKGTWGSDFCGEALADKRLINKIREELGSNKRLVDYVIEFALGVDNLVGYYQDLEDKEKIRTGNTPGTSSEKQNFYFGKFLREQTDGEKVPANFYFSELERFNQCEKDTNGWNSEAIFFDDPEFRAKFPEFNSAFTKFKEKKRVKTRDILQYLMDNSDFINRDENKWMKEVISVIRRTSIYFQPQIRTKIINEGWASLWHERLFMTDPRIRSHEVDYAVINSGVLANPKIGLNPYIIGKNLLEYIEKLAEKGKLSYEYQLTRNLEDRKMYGKNYPKGSGNKTLFETRINANDSILINYLCDDDFQDFVDEHKLFVADRRLNTEIPAWEYFIKSRKGSDYRQMLNDSLYHPPHIFIDEDKEDELYLNHVFEGRTLVTRYIPKVLIGLSFFNGTEVKLETTEFDIEEAEFKLMQIDPDYEPEGYKRLRVLYICKGKEITREVLDEGGEN